MQGTGAARTGSPERGRMLPDTLMPTRVSLSMRLGAAPDSALAAPNGHGSPCLSCKMHHTCMVRQVDASAAMLDLGYCSHLPPV